MSTYGAVVGLRATGTVIVDIDTLFGRRAGRTR